MDSVNDLLRTSPTQTVSLNTLRKQNEPTASVNINATTGEGLTNTTKPTNTINITANRTRPTRRTVTSADSINEIDPSTIVPKKEVKAGPTAIESAYQQLDATVKRKQDEYHNFINTALEMDKENRERVDAGLEKVEGEVTYIPEAVDEEIKKQDNKKNTNDIPSKKVEETAQDEVVQKVEDEKFFDDEEKDFFDDNSSEEMEAPHSVKIDSNPFASEEVHSTKNEVRPFSDYVPEETAHDILSTEPRTITTDDGIVIDEPVLVENIPDDVIKDIPVTGDNNMEENKAIDNTEAVVEDTKTAEVKEVSKQEEKKPVDDGSENVINAISKGSFGITSNVISDIENGTKDSSVNDFNLNEEDFEDVTNNAEDGEIQLTDEQIEEIKIEGAKNLKNEILDKIINTSNRVNISSFKVSNKVISIKDALKGSNSAVARTAEYPMMYAGRPFRASALKGSEIAMLADTDDSGTENSVGLTLDQAKIMYEHDANPYKPKTVEAWAKTIPFSDVESIFVALYLASLKSANYIPMKCSKQSCQYQFLSDDTPLDKMVKFKSDDVKKKFEEIKNVKITPENTGAYESVISQINDRFAVGLKIPSIYTILYEYASLNMAFARKYLSVISIMQYIDYIYIIDPETEQYKPIGWKTYPGDYSKSFRSKIATYAKVIKEFEDTDFSILTALINSMITRSSDARDITYEIPACKCQKCGTEIEAARISPRELVFMRQRLVVLATTRTER